MNLNVCEKKKKKIYNSLTFTITSTEKAVTANSHVDGECFVHSTVSRPIGATSRNRHTSKALACLFLEKSIRKKKRFHFSNQSTSPNRG